jgi:AcrR family transcriptional regulator
MPPGPEEAVVRPARPPGRPRLYGPDDERSRIMAAALVVLGRNQGHDIPVAEILAEAGLSTRAFYRHFDTKEDVIRALYQRDADSFGAHLAERVATAADPVEALETWVYEMLGLAYDRRRSERVSTFGSSAVDRAVSGSSAAEQGVAILVEPLRELLQRGLSSGRFPDARPDRDVWVIHAITWEAIGAARTGTVKRSRREAVDQVLRFAGRGLGYQP